MTDTWVGSGTPVRDMGLSRELSEVDLDSQNRRSNMEFIGLRLPNRPRRPRKHGHGHGHSHRKHRDKSDNVNSIDTVSPASLTPSEQVQQLIGDNEDNEVNKVFCQMDTLFKLANEMQWRESARWVKYEEDVEEGGERWSKPHVASLSLHSLFELRSSLLTGAVMLDMDAIHLGQVADLLLDQLVNNKLLEVSLRDDVRAAILASHRHQFQKGRKSTMPDDLNAFGRKMSMKRTFSEIGRKFSMKNIDSTAPQMGNMRGNPRSFPNMDALGDLPESPSSTNIAAKLNEQFMKKIPDGAVAANILVGELDTLKYQVAAFIRLTEPRTFGELTEVPLPTKFIFLLLGPSGSKDKDVEIGRAMATMMVDEVFREVAFRARNRQDLLSGIDEFLDQVTVLPPGEWDPKIRLEPPDSVPSQEGRKTAKPTPAGPKVAAEMEEEEAEHTDPTLVRSGRLFGGLINDIKRKLPFYGSDFKDCFHMQCVASTIFLYLATLTPNVTFGGLLGLATDQYMGTMECILTAAITGVLFALFSGQPLNILGSTGPMLVLEMILYNLCKDNGWVFLPVRLWVGLWTTLILLIIVALDLSALVRYITRFTEESFACLIALIFIYEAFKKVYGIYTKYPYNRHPEIPLNYDCECIAPNMTSMNDTWIGNFTTMSTVTLPVTTDAGYISNGMNSTMDNITTTFLNYTLMDEETCIKNNGTLIGGGCDTPHYYSDSFFLSVILFLGTFIIAYGLKEFKTSGYFPTYVRQYLSDFAVLIAIILMVGLDIALGVKTPKLQVPDKFAPTRPDRGWLVSPIEPRNPWWLMIAAVVPALLATILIFLDQQITAVIVNRKENKLKKGNGYHLDILVVAVCIALCSFLGLPWYVAATVSALAHIMSLKKETECTAPGEKPTFLGVREQRVTALLVGILSGVSVLMTAILRVIPMAVLYGVFLFMGVAALKGMQFIDRLLIVLMPQKYQPDFTYLRHVTINRVHLFTLMQLCCLIVLMVIKQIKSISIVFPLMRTWSRLQLLAGVNFYTRYITIIGDIVQYKKILGTCFVRKAMDYIFEQRELKWLDDIMPEDKKRAKEDEEKLEDGDEAEKENLLDDDFDKLNEIKIQHEKGEKFGHAIGLDDRVNITEEVNRTAIWLQVRRDSMPVLQNGVNEVTNRKHKSKPKSKSKESKEKENGSARNEKAAFFVGDDEDMREVPEEDRESKI